MLPSFRQSGAIGQTAGVARGEDEDARFTIRLNYPTSKNVTVNFETADRTAVAGQDYVARSGSVVIPAGQRRVEVDVDVLEDAVREPDETFVLRLTGSSNAPLSSDEGRREHDRRATGS